MPANWRTDGWRRDTWRRLYVREQGSFASLPFFARATAAMLLKLCDEKGRIEVGKSGDLVDAIAFRMGAEQGERRLLRKLVPQLFEEGYLVAEDDGRVVRIRNFEEAQGRGRGEREPSTRSSRGVHEVCTSSSRAEHENQPKQRELLKTTAVIEEKRREKKEEGTPEPPCRGESVSGPANDSDRRTTAGRRASDQFHDALVKIGEHYRKYHPRAFPAGIPVESKEAKNIRARIREGSTVEDICTAIDGYHLSPFHCGQNDTGTKHLGLELFTRTGSKLQTGIEFVKNPPRGAARAAASGSLALFHARIVEDTSKYD